MMKKILLEELNIDWERDTAACWKYGSVVKKNNEGHWQKDINVPRFTENRSYIESCLPTED